MITLAGAYGQVELPAAANVRVEWFVPHGPVLERAAAMICRSGMGIVQKAVAARSPPPRTSSSSAAVSVV